MNDLAEMERRMNLQQLCCFLSSGTELVKLEEGTCLERIGRREAALCTVLERETLDPARREQLCEQVMGCAGDCFDAYLEAGLRAGFRLAVQLLEGA